MARIFSLEDSNLNRRTIVTSRTVSHSDLDLSFEDRPNGDIFLKTEAEAVRQAVRNLLLTNLGEKPFQPFYGGGLNSFLFNLDTDFDAEEIEDRVGYAIANYEPRAIIQNVNVSVLPEYNGINVRVLFRVVNFFENLEVNIDLTRLR